MVSFARCARCIMDTSDPDIIFDHAGICNHCSYVEQKAKSEFVSERNAGESLERLIRSIKNCGKDSPYDCIVGVSGGVDSTYVAYLAKKWGLRPLAVHFDNGWNSELAVDNIKKVLNTLNIDLCTYVVDWKEFKDLQLSFLKSSVANAEIPTDHAINAVLYRYANKHGIKAMLNGGNMATESIMPRSWMEHSFDLTMIKDIQKKFGTKKLRSFPMLSPLNILYFSLVKKIKIIKILDFVDYDKNAAIKILEEKLGWRSYGGKHYESIYTRFFQGYILPTKFKIDKRLAHLSSLILSGQISRENALEEIQKSPYPDENMLLRDKDYCLKKLGLTELEFEKIMSNPIKTYSDFKNIQWAMKKFGFVYEAMKKIILYSAKAGPQ